MAIYTFEIPEEIAGFMRRSMNIEPEKFLEKQLKQVFKDYKESRKEEKLSKIEEEVDAEINEVKERVKATKVPDDKVKDIEKAIKKDK